MPSYSVPENPTTLAKRYEDQARIQRTLVAELTALQQTIARLLAAFGTVLSDEDFVTLLRADKLDSAPGILVSRLAGREPITDSRNEARHPLSGSIEGLKSPGLSPTARCELRRMISSRQEEVATLMVASGCCNAPYVRALIGASDDSQMALRKGRPRLVMRQPRKAAANEEISRLARQMKRLSGLSAADQILVFMSVGYARRLLKNSRVRAFLKRRFPCVLSDLADLIESRSRVHV